MLESHMARAVLAVLTLSVCSLSLAFVTESGEPNLSTVQSLSEFRVARESLANVRFHPGARLVLASTDGMSPMLAPMLALYSQLLSLDGNGSGGIALKRLEARLGSQVADKTGLLDINDVLASDLDAVEVLAVGSAQLKGLGIAASDVDKLPVLGSLTDKVKGTMMELPQGLASFTSPVALAVWGEEAGKPKLVTLVIRAN